MNQYLFTVDASKRLIAKAILHIESVQTALKKGTIVIIAGTTNGYVAEELLNSIGIPFDRSHFYRGVNLDPSISTTEKKHIKDSTEFPGDVIIKEGKYISGKTVYDIIDNLKEGDIVFKGANAVDVEHRVVGVLLGNPDGGTIAAAMRANRERGVEVIIPVSLEKRVYGDMYKIAERVNVRESSALKLWATKAHIVTELDAIKILTEAEATLIAAGGVFGAEGSIMLSVSGASESLDKCRMLYETLQQEFEEKEFS